MSLFKIGPWQALIALVAVASLITGCSSNETEKPANEMQSMEEKKAPEQSTEDNASKEEEKKEEMDEQQPPMAEKGEEVTGNMASPLLKKGEKVTYTFPDEGVYMIHCDPHPVMKMKVTVQADAEKSGSIALDIADYEYSEKEVVVAPGTTITWTNQDVAQHNVAIEAE
ncbi:hypothetical protein KUV80_11805 [Fictibacillus nanhaiensis]|uniref:plastocyanin/azurin family copper-binding protein n=1 Tax=Fictibacillus nanhaiensis TaxID=742169 RepID=UPI001C974ADC|nr:plastocyanin/azurin family copper-binding protein [Fictibacillus nanhaiensis]MBY6037347.1 hypothetical protein [Fictibacillus nanhaiensis]